MSEIREGKMIYRHFVAMSVSAVTFKRFPVKLGSIVILNMLSFTNSKKGSHKMANYQKYPGTKHA